MSADNKSRQSSGGKSFFSRSKKEKGDRKYFNDEGYLGADLDKASSISSRSSRHTRESSVASIERPNSPPLDSTGLAMMSGVITSIPYDSVAADSKSPIPVDYLPRSDQMPVRRDPLPHHLNKGGGDFHQYPSFDPASLSNPNSHLTGPRPAPGATNVTMASTGNRTTQLQQWGPGSRSTVSAANGAHTSRYDSYSTNNSSNYTRSSIDQSSITSGTER